MNIPITFYDRVVAADGDTRQAITPALPPTMEGSVCGSFPRRESPAESDIDCKAPPLILAVPFAMANSARLMCSFHTARMIEDSAQAHPAVPNDGWSDVPYRDWTGYYLYWAEQADIAMAVHSAYEAARPSGPARLTIPALAADEAESYRLDWALGLVGCHRLTANDVFTALTVAAGYGY